MKKILCFVIFSLFFMTIPAQARYYHPHSYYHNTYPHSYYHSGYYSGCSNCVYIVKSDFSQKEEIIPNCDKFTILVNSTTNFYSNGARRIFSTYTVLNKDKTALISDCYSIEHTTYNKKHYFIAKIGKYYKVIDEKGNSTTLKNYSYMKKVTPNKILVCLNKNYGMIDLAENTIIPIKYKSFEEINSNLFITKLNGYYGLIDNSNNIILKNEYDNIKPLYETYIIRKEGKFGLIDKQGKIILESNNDKIKKLGEYILVKKDGLYGVFDYKGQQIAEIKYKKIKLDRNTLKYKEKGNWEEV